MRCYATGCTFRTDRALAERPREQMREHAADSGHALCEVCGQSLMPSERRVCDEPRWIPPARTDPDGPERLIPSCVMRAREALSGVVTMWLETDRLLGLRLGSDLAGDDGFTLVGPGGTGSTGRRLWPSEIEQGLVQHLDGREHAVDNRPDDPASVVQLLTQWEDDWRRTRSETASLLPPAASVRVLHATAGYLDVRMRWAAREHEAFSEFLTDLHGLHGRLEVVTHRLRRSSRANASCFDCGGQLVRRVDPDTGLEETVRNLDTGADEPCITCARCRRQYSSVEYTLALRASYDSGLEGWVTVRDAAAATKRSTDTLKSWVARGVVESACRLKDRRQLVWWPDVHARTTRAQRRTRKVAS